MGLGVVSAFPFVQPGGPERCLFRPHFYVHKTETQHFPANINQRLFSGREAGKSSDL